MELTPMNAQFSTCPSDADVPGQIARAMVPRRSVAGILATLGLVTAGCFLVMFRPVEDMHESRPATMTTQKLDLISEASANETEKKIKKCSKTGESCYNTKCCSVPGTQCYLKKDNWATCRVTCNPGPDPFDDNSDHWSCQTLGERAPGPAPPPNFALKKADWVDSECANVSSSCENSMCCTDAGKQCYKKSDKWFACKEGCVAGGPDPVDANSDPWDCTELGSRTPGAVPNPGKPAPWVAKECSWNNESCSDSKCCRDPGHTCYTKTQEWAQCMPACTPGPILTDREFGIWECKALGMRTPGMAQQAGHVRPARWVEKKCAKTGSNCTDEMCCAEATYRCYEKNKEWSSCMRGCYPGHPQAADEDETPWTCATKGPRTPRDWQSPSLYCFHIIRVNSYEADITRFEAQKNGGVGIFGCELYDVFASDGDAWLGDGPLGPIRTHFFQPAAISRSVDGTAGNTALFMNAWASVGWIGNWKLTDWTIKVDPDAVLLPDKMRYGHLKFHTGVPGYIVNCNKAGMSTGPMMFGSIEAISRQALERYFANPGRCSFGYEFGEDRWFGNCLASLGAQGIPDFGMVGDNVCTGANCGDGKAAYHPFKNTGAWAGCFAQATR